MPRPCAAAGPRATCRARSRALPRSATGPRTEALAQRLAFQPLGDDLRLAVVGADVEDRQDVRVIELASRARFRSRTGGADRSLSKLRRQDLDARHRGAAASSWARNTAHRRPRRAARLNLVGADASAWTDRQRGRAARIMDQV